MSNATEQPLLPCPNSTISVCSPKTPEVLNLSESEAVQAHILALDETRTQRPLTLRLAKMNEGKTLCSASEQYMSMRQSTASLNRQSNRFSTNRFSMVMGRPSSSYRPSNRLSTVMNRSSMGTTRNVGRGSIGTGRISGRGSQLGFGMAPSPSTGRSGWDRIDSYNQYNPELGVLEVVEEVDLNLQAFNRTILEETEHTPIPPGVIPPCCDCELKCQMRKIEAEGVCMKIWVCAHGQCLSYQDYQDFDSAEDVDSSEARQTVNLADELDQPSTELPPWQIPDIRPSDSYGAHALAFPHQQGDYTPDGHGFHGFGMHDRRGGAAHAGSAHGTIGSASKTPQEFWDDVRDEMEIPDADVAALLISFMEMPYCDCPLPARLVICKNSGDIFWACAVDGCYFLQLSKHRPAANDIDVGQFFPIGSLSIDRYTTIGHIMKWFGRAFSISFWMELNNRHEDDDFTKESKNIFEKHIHKLHEHIHIVV